MRRPGPGWKKSVGREEKPRKRGLTTCFLLRFYDPLFICYLHKMHTFIY